MDMYVYNDEGYITFVVLRHWLTHGQMYEYTDIFI
jgi:hypothetical protein